jgi:hypothetical protein
VLVFEVIGDEVMICEHSRVKRQCRAKCLVDDWPGKRMGNGCGSFSLERTSE